MKRQGWRCSFITNQDSLELIPDISAMNTIIISPSSLYSELDAIRNLAIDDIDLLLIDHYGLGQEFESETRTLAKKIAAMDDVPSRRHDVDLLIDQTAGRQAREYDGLVPQSAMVLAGREYVLLRPEIFEKRPRTRHGKVAELLVSFGGGDNNRLSEMALLVLLHSGFSDISCTLVLGPGQATSAAMMTLPARNVRVVVDPLDFPDLMARADIALAGSGTTAWELAYLGVPSLLVINSPGTVVQGLTEAGVSISLGSDTNITADDIKNELAMLVADENRRTSMSMTGQRLIDGQGAHRIVNVVESLQW